MDLGTWRAYKVCAVNDDDIRTLSGEQVDGSDRSTPGTDILREYSPGSGLEKSLAARELFPTDSGNYAAMNSVLTCSRAGVHALTGDGLRIRYDEENDLTINTVVPPSEGWELTGYADTPERLYALIHIGPSDLYALDKVEGRDSFKWRRVRLSKDCNMILATKQPKSDAPLIGTHGLFGWEAESQAGLVYRQHNTPDALTLPLGCLE